MRTKMKRNCTLKLLAFVILALVGMASQAIAQVEDFDVDGIHVLLESTKANQIVAVLVGIEGGFGYSEINNFAVPEFTANVIAASGSVKYPKEKYRRELARLVSSIEANATPYVTHYTLSCVKPNLMKSWDIFADVLVHPAIDQQEFERVRQDWLTSIDGRKADPEGYAAFMLDSIWTHGSHAWPIVEPGDIKSIDPDGLRQWHEASLVRSRMTITVVGDVSRGEITALIKKDLSTIPQKVYTRKQYERIVGPNKTDLVVDNRVVPTAYIFGQYLAPPKADKAYYALLMGALILDDRLYEEVRTKRNLSYAPHSRLGGAEGKYIGLISVSTTMPDSTVHVIVRELEKIRRDGVTAKELKDRRAEFITEFYMSQQTNLALATRLYTTYRETGDWHAALSVIKDMNTITLPEIQDAMQKYMHNILWTAVGERSKMDTNNFLFQ